MHIPIETQSGKVVVLVSVLVSLSWRTGGG